MFLGKYRELSSEFAPWKCLLKSSFRYGPSLFISFANPDRSSDRRAAQFRTDSRREGDPLAWVCRTWRGGDHLCVHPSKVTFCTCKRGFLRLLFLKEASDHDKGQKSAMLGCRLHWRLSTEFFAFSPVFMCNLVRRAPLKSGESSGKSSGENRVKSCHVCDCHGFFGPDFPEGSGQIKSTIQRKSTAGSPKAHMHELFGPVALGTTPDFSQGQTRFVPGTKARSCLLG